MAPPVFIHSPFDPRMLSDSQQSKVFPQPPSGTALPPSQFGTSTDVHSPILAADPSAQRFDLSVIMQNDGSSTNLLNRIKSKYASIRSIGQLNEETYTKN